MHEECMPSLYHLPAERHLPLGKFRLTDRSGLELLYLYVRHASCVDLSAEPIQVKVFVLCSIAPVGGFLAGLDCKLLRVLLQVPLQAGCQGCGAAGCSCRAGQSRCGNASALAMAVPSSPKALPCCVFDDSSKFARSAPIHWSQHRAFSPRFAGMCYSV